LRTTSSCCCCMEDRRIPALALAATAPRSPLRRAL
jgi:hypothetical protein